MLEQLLEEQEKSPPAKPGRLKGCTIEILGCCLGEVLFVLALIGVLRGNWLCVAVLGLFVAWAIFVFYWICFKAVLAILGDWGFLSLWARVVWGLAALFLIAVAVGFFVLVLAVVQTWPTSWPAPRR